MGTWANVVITDTCPYEEKINDMLDVAADFKPFNFHIAKRKDAIIIRCANDCL